MMIDPQKLDLAFRGFKARYTDTYNKTPTYSDGLAMTIASAARHETYGWLGQWPQLREWVGDRVVRQLKAHSFTIANRKFESTIEVSRDDYADDRYGVFGPMVAEMGHLARQHADKLIFGLMASGATQLCYDGKPYFAPDHEVPHPTNPEGGAPVEWSNIEDGAGPAWFLFDTSRNIKPFIWQEREKYDFQTVTAPNDARVFMTDKYLYGVRARVNAGFGLWQLGFMSKHELTVDSYAAARQKMMRLRGDRGGILGIMPDVLVVPPSLETNARLILNAATGNAGASNIWAGSAKLIVTPYLEQ